MKSQLKRKSSFSEDSASEKKQQTDNTDFQIDEFGDVWKGDVSDINLDDSFLVVDFGVVLSDTTASSKSALPTSLDTLIPSTNDFNLSDSFLDIDLDTVNTNDGGTSKLESSSPHTLHTNDINLNDSFPDFDIDSAITNNGRCSKFKSALPSSSDSLISNTNDNSLVGDSVITNGREEFDAMLTWEVTEIVDTSSSSMKEKELNLKLESDTVDATCSLRGDWYFMEIHEHDKVYISGLSITKRSCIVDNFSSNYMISYPNTLISGTTIATGITCERKAILNEWFKINTGSNQAMFLGTITHDLFDWVLQHNDCTYDDIEARARENLNNVKYLEQLSILGISIDEIIDNQKEYYCSLENWSKQFMRDDCDTEIDFKMGDEGDGDVTTCVHIDNVVDIEENVWAPCYGLKGRVDATVQVSIHRKPKLKHHRFTKYNLPLEFKTGKLWSRLGSVEHRAQVIVYTLLLSERYKSNIDTGLLFYGKDNHMVGIPRPQQEKRAILIKRNEISRHLSLERKSLKLPPLIHNTRWCKRCDQNANCMLYFKALENGDATSSGMEKLFTELTSHLTSEGVNYFAKWYKLSILEATYTNKECNSKYIWKQSAKQRENDGICFSGMINIDFDDSNADLLCKFRRKDGHFNSGCSLKLIPLGIGERVIISKENTKVFNITTAYIRDVSFDVITVSLQHKVRTIKAGTIFRIDKDDTLSNYTTPLSNLAQLFSHQSTDDKLRKLILGCRKPSFSTEKSQEIGEESAKEDSVTAIQGKALDSVFSELNAVQKSAIEKCLSADDCVIILGMPGAGKSTTIACLVRALVSIGKSVLLTSYTHSAVDTILLKLQEVGFNDFVRIGQPSRVHPKIHTNTYHEHTKSFTAVQDFENYYAKQVVVATTSLGINHPIFLKKRFDYCIVDEASQITQPVCIGPIRNADVFVLVGDNNQLPPLVLNPEARENGLECSLFKSLSELYPETVVTLNYQYRMNASIMFLMNTLVYQNCMKCGSEVIANALLKLPAYDVLYQSNKTQLWDIINPRTPVVFVNTDDVPLTEEKSGSFIVNRGEASLVKQLVSVFLQCGLSCNDVGVISSYRHQVNVIRNEICDVGELIEVDTMDKYQGKDKACIIISFVRSNLTCEVGELLNDWRRINVAITRAKTKLIMIGSRKTIVKSKFLCKLLDLIDDKGWCFNLKNT